MANLSFQILDDVLAKIELSTKEKPIDLEILIKINFQSFDLRDVKVIMDKLEIDKMIDFVIPNIDGTLDEKGLNQDRWVKNKRYYFVTFEGLLLLQDDGYVEKKKRETILETRQLLMTVAIALFSGLAALGTLGLLFFEWLKYQPNTFCLFPLRSISLIYFSGVVTGLIATITTQQLNKLMPSKNP